MSNLNLNKYASFAEYYADTRPVGEHNVSYIGNEYVIYDDEEIYDMQGNKIDWNYYLNFYMPNGGTISLNKIGTPTVVELEYSLDKGQTWTVWAEDGSGNRSLTLTAGQRMYVRNTSETSTRFSISASSYYKFDANAPLYADGLIGSLLCKNAQNAIINVSCFNRLFIGNIFLIKSPILQFTTLVNSCYALMFYECTSLNEIHSYMTNISESDCLAYWLYNTSPQGDFYCPASLTIPTGSSGIPSGWTRHDI